MNSSVKTLILTAAVTGLFGGTSARLNAQPAAQPNGQRQRERKLECGHRRAPEEQLPGHQQALL